MKPKSIPSLHFISQSSMARIALFVSLSFGAAHGAAITQTANDTIGLASFTDSARWSNTAAPSAGNTYSNNGWLFRTPDVTTASITFAGDSLTLTPKSSTSGVGAALIVKGTTNQTITFSNLILDGGIFSQGQAFSTKTIAGAITANSTSGFSITDSSDRNLTINSTVSGSGRLHVGSFNNYNASGYTPTAFTNIFSVNGNNSSFSGGWTLGGSYTSTFFGGSTTYLNKFNASGTTLRLGHANALGTGTLEINQGILNLNGYSPTGLAGITLPDGASATIRTGSQSITATNFNFGSSSGAALTIDLQSTGYPTTARISSTNLAVNGASTIALNNVGYSVGTIPLISYSGSVGGSSGFSGLSLILPAGVTGSLVNNSGVSVDANITAVDALTWNNGATTGIWNTTDLNWLNSSNASTAYSQTAAGGYSVVFNETETTASPVGISVPSTVSPNSVTISNATKDYTFTGAGSIAGSGSLTKTGAGTASISNTLTYAGNTTISGGRLTLNGASNTLASGTVTVNSGAYLTYNNSANTTQGAATSAGMTFTGSGTLEKKGSNTLVFANGTGKVNWNFGAGALIDVQAGKLTGGSNDNDVWTNNKASLNIASGATFEAVEANVFVDALTGAGTYQAGYFGPRNLTLGANNGSGDFSGSIQSNGQSAQSSVILYKIGTGTQTLSGAVNIQNAYSGTVLNVSKGTLNFSPTLSSVIGSTGSDVYISPAQTDDSTFNQTAGTITTRNLSIGQAGRATYNISGGIINTPKIELAFTGPSSGTGAVALNISSSAQVNITGGGSGMLLGQFYGRPVTVTQTGGNVICFSDSGTTRGGSQGLRFWSSNTTSAYNLDGGTLSIPAITWAASQSGYGGGNGTLNFNGGTLQITSASFTIPTTVVNGNPAVMTKVKEGGAIIDSYGLSITLNSVLAHAGSADKDGGLTLNDSATTAGTLTLSAVNTYTGDTQVVRGTLSVSNACLDDNANVKITTGGTLNLTHTGNDQVGALYIDGVKQANGVWGAIGSGAANETALITGTGLITAGVAGTPFSNWADGKGLTANVNAGLSDDPDRDGLTNMVEFAFDGNPLSSSNEGKVVGKVAVVGGYNVFTLTLPVRNTATFSGVTEQVSTAVDGIVYKIQGTSTLSTWDEYVSEITGGDVATIQAGLPSLSEGWSYRSFRVQGNLNNTAQSYMRATIESAQ